MGKGVTMPDVPAVPNPEPHAIAEAEARTVRLEQDLEIAHPAAARRGTRR